MKEDQLQEVIEDIEKEQEETKKKLSSQQVIVCVYSDMTVTLIHDDMVGII